MSLSKKQNFDIIRNTYRLDKAHKASSDLEKENKQVYDVPLKDQKSNPRV